MRHYGGYRPWGPLFEILNWLIDRSVNPWYKRHGGQEDSVLRTPRRMRVSTPWFAIVSKSDNKTALSSPILQSPYSRLKALVCPLAILFDGAGDDHFPQECETFSGVVPSRTVVHLSISQRQPVWTLSQAAWLLGNIPQYQWIKTTFGRLMAITVCRETNRFATEPSRAAIARDLVGIPPPQVFCSEAGGNVCVIWSSPANGSYRGFHRQR